MIIENPGQVAKHIHVRFGFYYPCIITSQRSERASKTGPLYCLSSPVGALDVCMPLRKSRGWTRGDRKQNRRGRSNAHHIAYHFIPHTIPSIIHCPSATQPATIYHRPPTLHPRPRPHTQTLNQIVSATSFRSHYNTPCAGKYLVDNSAVTRYSTLQNPNCVVEKLRLVSNLCTTLGLLLNLSGTKQSRELLLKRLYRSRYCVEWL